MLTYPQVDPLQKSRSPSQGGASKEMQVGTQFTCFTCFTGTPVRALLVHQCANKEMQVGTQFTCFTGARVRAFLVHQ
jgi:hypothetical protein